MKDKGPLLSGPGWTALIILILIPVGLIFTYVRHMKPASTAVGVTVDDKAPSEADDGKGAKEAQAEQDDKDAGYQKICGDLARDFVEAVNPTREQQSRTLILYNVNRCSNMFIRDAAAGKHGLTDAELKAVKADQEVGGINVEDR